MKRIFYIILFLGLGIFDVQADAEKTDAFFSKCVDGDTIDLIINNEEHRVRLLAIDTPESVKPNTEVQEFGKEASEYTCNLVQNANKIMVEYDIGSKQDKYGRDVAWVWVDDNLLQLALINEGYAEVAYVYENYKYVKELCMVQAIAQANEIGIWKNNRQAGYCSTVSISDSERSISVDDLAKIFKTGKKLDNASDKINNFISSDNFVSIGLIILLVVAAISEIYKSIKK